MLTKAVTQVGIELLPWHMACPAHPGGARSHQCPHCHQGRRRRPRGPCWHSAQCASADTWSCCVSSSGPCKPALPMVWPSPGMGPIQREVSLAVLPIHSSPPLLLPPLPSCSQSHHVLVGILGDTRPKEGSRKKRGQALGSTRESAQNSWVQLQPEPELL